MKTRISFMLFLMFFATNVCRPETSDITRNGYWWQGMSPQFKLGFISGYVLAESGGHEVAALKCLAAKPKPITDEVINSCDNDPIALLFTDFSNIHFGQLLEGTDEFYKDFKNKNLSIGTALHYVRDELKGMSADKLSEELIRWRRFAAAH